MIEALLELQFCDSNRANAFNCLKCTDKIKKLRRCQEDRFDFTPEDAQLFPIKLQDNGGLYGFCPGKATWDLDTSNWYHSLKITSETGNLHFPGSLNDQPFWYIELLSFFVSAYNDYRFYSRAKAILDDGKSGSKLNGSNTKPINDKSKHRIR